MCDDRCDAVSDAAYVYIRVNAEQLKAQSTADRRTVLISGSPTPILARWGGGVVSSRGRPDVSATCSLLQRGAGGG